MNSQIFEGYLKHVQKLASQLDHEPGSLQELLRYIETTKDEHVSDQACEEFFKGEYAFYSGHYESAVKHYLQAKGIEHFEFFCYRASAQISMAQGFFDKALTFAQKALEIYPDDYAILILISKLLKQLDREQEANEFLEKAQKNSQVMCKAHAGSAQYNEGHTPSLMITENELKELAGIFSPGIEKEELFCMGQSETSHAFFSGVSVDLFSKELESTSAASQSKIPSPKLTHIDDVTQMACNEHLSEKMAAFQRFNSQSITHYLDKFTKRTALPEYALYILQGWCQSPMSTQCDWEFLTENSRQANGGIYLRWNHKGLVINPGKDFLKNFHQQGLHIKDIDYVIVTREHENAYSDIKQIYDLAFLLNQASDEPRVIHYYLNQKVYHDLTSVLKPRFKQERYAVHNLELFSDVSEDEKIELSSDITLHYFQASSVNILGIRLELAFSRDSLFHSLEEENGVINLGYVSHGSWSTHLAKHLTPCDFLLVGIGNTDQADYQKITHANDQLGYFGSYSLLEAVNPKILLCTEFGGRDGDIRLELIKKMRREEFNRHKAKHTAILPADIGLVLDLKTGKVKCSSTGRFTDIDDVCVVRSGEMFSPLLYLSPACYA